VYLPNYTHPEGSRQRLGVSVVICCHNSETLLPATVLRLKNQHASDVSWEVLVIDNASTDKTALVARECWGDDWPAPMRIIHEPRLGLCYARERAFEEAQYEIVSFVDDDNWVTPEWVCTVSECMSADSKLGAIGSLNTAVADVPFPEWFSRYCHYYAAWAYREPATFPTWALSGAGMSIRKSTWQNLRRDGFRLSLTGRLGNRLSSCEDVEIGCAIQLASWKIRVEPRLQLQHYMTPTRLQWTYLRALLRGVGEANVILDSYLFVSQSDHVDLLNRLRLCWWTRLAKEILYLIHSSRIAKLIGSSRRDMEGDDEVADIELRIGRLLGLLRLRSRYGQLRQDVARARWRRVDALADAASTRDCLEGGILLR
jgi:cellulose synthase/poly-beta-1,6-N-acetylglucosamine synthase-like glycosyltransferase